MLKWILLATVILFASFNANAQLSGQARIDSLIKELPKMKEDTNAIKLLAVLSVDYYLINLNQSVKYAEQGLNLAKKIKWKQGEAECYNALGVIYSFGKSDYPKALEYYKKSLKISEELDNIFWVAKNLANIGIIYHNQSDYPKALEYYSKSLKISEELDNKLWVTKILGNIGIIFQNQSDYPKALEYFHKALKIDEEIGYKSGVARNFNSIGNIYYEQSDYPQALGYYNKSLKIYEELQDRSGIALNLGNIAAIYRHQSDYSKAIEYHQKALKIDDELGDRSSVARHLGNIGVIYSDQSDYSKALEYFNKALEIYEELGNKLGVALNLSNMGCEYYNLSIDTVLSKVNEGTELVGITKDINLNRSIEYLLQSIKIFEEIGELNTRSKSLYFLANAYKNKEDYKNSDKYIREHLIIKDSVFNAEKSKEIARLNNERENLAREKEISELKSANEINEIKLSRVLNFVIFLIVTSILMMFLAFLIYQKNRTKNKLINSLYESEKQLNAAISDKDKLFSIIGHDLKNPIGAMMLSNSLLIDKFYEIDDSLKKDIIQKNQDSVMHLLKLLDDLLTWSRSQQGKIEFNPETIECDLMLNNIKILLSDMSSKKDISLNVNSEENLKAYADRMMLNTILRNLITNSIKFTQKGGEIYINAQKTDDNTNMIKFSIKDNGVGMDEATRNKLFQSTKTVSVVGTNNEKGTGLGLQLCKEFVETHKGKIWVESELGKGSTFYFTVPCLT